MDDYIKVASVDEIPLNGSLLVEVDDVRIALFNLDGEIYAIEDTCTHDGGPLGDGELNGYQIICPRHGARFDVRTGDALKLPAFEPVATYQVKVENGDLLVESY